MFGTDRILNVLNTCRDASPEQIIGEMKQAVSAFSAGAQQFDDITMICLTCHGPQEKQ